jgi:hypothetical protein
MELGLHCEMRDPIGGRPYWPFLATLIGRGATGCHLPEWMFLLHRQDVPITPAGCSYYTGRMFLLQRAQLL